MELPFIVDNKLVNAPVSENIIDLFDEYRVDDLGEYAPIPYSFVVSEYQKFESLALNYLDQSGNINSQTFNDFKIVGENEDSLDLLKGRLERHMHQVPNQSVKDVIRSAPSEPLYNSFKFQHSPTWGFKNGNSERSYVQTIPRDSMLTQPIYNPFTKRWEASRY